MHKVAGPLAIIAVCVTVILTLLVARPLHADATSRPSAEATHHARLAPMPGKPPKHVRVDPDRVTFLHKQPDDPSRPVAWDPCSPIHYVINPANSPTGGIATIQNAMAYLSRTTGYVFVYDGVTNEQHTPGQDRRYQPDRYGDRWAPVLIEWLPTIGTDEEPAVGVASPTPAMFDDGVARYVSGVIRLSQKEFTKYQENAAASITKKGKRRHLMMQRSVIVHEALHVLGLGHSNTMTDIMFPGITYYTSDLSVQDVIGLRKLGKQPCYVP